MIQRGQPIPAAATRLVDYGSFALYRVERQDLSTSAAAGLLVDADTLYFDRATFDTQRGQLSVPTGFSLTQPSAAAIHIVQFVGPIKNDWLAQVRAAGAVPFQYIANHGYLVWADASARSQLQALAQQGDVVQFQTAMQPFMKLGLSLFQRAQRGAGSDETMLVTVQRYRGAPLSGRDAIFATRVKPDTEWAPVMEFENIKVHATLQQVLAIANLPDVYFVNEFLPREMMDEVQAQIVRGFLTPDQSGPAGEGYLTWLNSLGFPQTPSSYAVVDVTDSGLGDGSSLNPVDVTFYEQGVNTNPTRVVFNQNCNSTSTTPGVHGHLNANIVAGYDVRTNAQQVGARFPGNYQRGQGINPYGRVASTRIFTGGGTYNVANCGGTDQGVIKASQDAGAVISNNSWGCSGCAGTYDDSSQAYDVGTRDADTTQAGNQPITFVFSAGNSGPGAATVGTPGNGKNMITVGAAENARPVDENGNWTDGCAIGPTGADDAMDVIGFSSRGPSPGNRRKPEVIAPGTHITGTKPVPNSGSGACDISRPAGNTVYAASSGTSHSAPAVAAVAQLAHWWIQNDQGVMEFEGGSASAPSPALMKAWMMAHPTYLTGDGANDTLPSNSQGYGMPTMGLMFDQTAKYLVNQTTVLNNTGEEWTWIGSTVDSARPTRIALAYTDQAGAQGTSPQVNNLNLEVRLNGSTLYRGNVFTGASSTTGGTADAQNNYEAVFLPAGTTGALEIKVIGANIAGDGVPGTGDTTDQDFGLVCFNCSQQPTFTLVGSPDQTLCTQTATSAVYNLTIGSVLGFNTPVNLTASGNPAGSNTGFSTNPVTPPGTSDLTVSNLGSVTAGSYTVAVNGVAGPESRGRNLGLSLFTDVPSITTLTAPANSAINVSPTTTFTWAASTQAASYLIEVATDAAFANIVYSATVTDTSAAPGAPLNTSTQYFWRVRPTNICGNGTQSTVFSFTTQAAPGDCGIGSTANVIVSENFNAGGLPAGWATTGSTGTSTWASSTLRPFGGSGSSLLAVDLATLSDQRLITSAIALPTGQDPITLQFQSDQTIEDDPPDACFDGGIIEVSTDNGANFSPLPATAMLTDPYNGPVDGGFSSPIAGQQAWCGDPQAYLRSVVDLSAFAGQSVRLRFRLATDTTVGRAPNGWFIDNFSVQSCQVGAGDNVFANGFE